MNFSSSICERIARSVSAELGRLCQIFVVLKMFDLIQVSWWWVASPIGLAAIVSLVMASIDTAMEEKEGSRV